LARRLSFVHLSGPRRGAVDEVPLPADVGSAEEARVLVPGSAPSHCHVFERDGDVVLRDGGSEAGTLLAGEPVHEAVLRDGDVLELGSGGPRLRLRDEEEKRIPLGKALAWARPEGSPHLSDAGFLARALLHETHVRTSPLFRWAVGLLLVAGALVLGWSQYQASLMRAELAKLRQDVQQAEQERLTFYARIEQERSKADRDRSALESQIEDLRQREGALKAQLGEATAGQVAAVRDDLVQTRLRLQNLESERAVGERIIREYGPGVGLIQGTYAFYDKSSRPLRYRLDDDDRIVRDDSGTPVLDPAGSGRVHSVEYFGTGFLVDGRKGLLLTNRHVAEPWWNDASAQLQVDKGYSPRFTSFRAFFPQETEPFELEVERLSETTDLAVVRLETRRHKVPVLPLDRSGGGAVAGQPVVVVGYPAGLEAILAKQDGTVVKDLLAGSGTSTDRVTEALSKKGLIRPSTTQGHIGDITKSDIVFDAPTTQGGSGGPILNRNGVVIAVEYAVLSKFGGNSFGVPIHYAFELLKPPKPSK
jgi:S1-C subfamily serine protease